MTAPPSSPSSRDGSNVAVRASIDLGSGRPAEMVMRMAIARGPDVEILAESFTIGGQSLDAIACDGSSVTYVRTSGESSQILYEAAVVLRARPAPPPLSLFDRLEFTTQSRYCPSDLMAGLASSLFGPVSGTTAIDAVAAWVREHIAYQFFSSQGSTTAVETLATAAGVCRDFAHLTICLLRGLGVPARYVAAYAPGLEPQDFHALVEAHDGNGWRLVDATGLADVTYALRIATGRDGADTPFLSVLSGFAPVQGLAVDARLT